MRENVWNRRDGGDQAEVQLTVGTYVLHFNTSYLPNRLIPKTIAQREMTLIGKRVRIDNWSVMNSGNSCELTITLLENPLPLVGIVLAVGVIGITAAMLLDSVDKVSEDVKETVKSPGFLLVAFAVLAFVVAPYVRPYLRSGS